MSRKRRIKKARVRFISLVPKGANQLPTIYKSDDGKDVFDLAMLIKDGQEEGELLAVSYSPELRDSQGDIASQPVIKEMMYESSRDGVSIDIRHDGKALSKEDAFIAESFIIQKTDTRFQGMTKYNGTPVDVTGGWGVVLKIDSEDLRKQYRDGVWKGVSIGGVAEMEETDKSEDSIPSWFRNLFKKETPKLKKETDMDEEKLASLLAKRDEDNKTTLLKEIVPMLAEAVAKALAPKKKETIEDDKGNVLEKQDDGTYKMVVTKKEEKPLSPAQELRKKAMEARKDAIMEDLDETDPDALEKAAKEMEELEKEFAAPKRKSNQGVSKGNASNDSDFDEDIVKEMVKLAS